MRPIAWEAGAISNKIRTCQFQQTRGRCAMKRRFVVLAATLAACVMPALGQTCPPGANWCSGTYRYDGMGNIRAIGSDIYIYDTAGPLVSRPAENQRGGASRQEYGYDAFGNRTSASRIAGSVD